MKPKTYNILMGVNSSESLSKLIDVVNEKKKKIELGITIFDKELFIQYRKELTELGYRNSPWLDVYEDQFDK